MFSKDKKGQATLFIIIGIVIVGAIVFLTATKKLPFISPAAPEKLNVEECIKESIDNALDIILPQGGTLNPTNYQLYKGKKIAFLCYTNQFYSPCIIQVPFLGEQIKRGIEEYAGDKIKDCFYALEQDYKDKGYRVESSPLNFSVEILPNKLSVLIKKKMVFIKGEERQVYEEFKMNKPSNLFSMMMVVHDIIDQEARFCNFEYIGYMFVHPEFSITKDTIGTEVKVYSVRSKKTGEEINLAVRSCAIAPGGI